MNASTTTAEDEARAQAFAAFESRLREAAPGVMDQMVRLRTSHFDPALLTLVPSSWAPVELRDQITEGGTFLGQPMVLAEITEPRVVITA